MSMAHGVDTFSYNEYDDLPDFCRVDHMFLPRAALGDYLRAKEAAAKQEDDAPQLAQPVPVALPQEQNHPKPRQIPVFTQEGLDRMKGVLSKGGSLAKLALTALMQQGYRSVPVWPDLSEKLCAFRREFPNFADMLEALECDLTLANAARPEDFRVSPVLLHGAPGIGKTYMASCLATVLGVPFAKITASGAQASFTFVGSSSHWSNSQPGRIFELLAESDSACAVLLIDEADKIHSDGRYPVVPALLDMLEGETARRLRDESLGVDMDASKLIIILTANEISSISPPLLSRVQAYEVAAPSVEQRMMIIRRQVENLQEHTRQQIDLAEDECVRLAESLSLDLRELQRLVRKAFGQAIAGKVHQLQLDIPAAPTQRRFGFL